VRIGHGDWESQKIRWTDREPLAVHDWGSVIAQPEMGMSAQRRFDGLYAQPLVHACTLGTNAISG
jgi:hypothetical protein